MACLGVQAASFGSRRMPIAVGVSEDIHCQFRRSMTVFRDNGRRRWWSPTMCVDNRGGLGDRAAVDGTLRLVRTGLNNGSRQKKPTVSPQLDQLMKESVAEIVRNINEAPFLLQAYSEDQNGDRDGFSSTSPLRLVIEKATSESWPFIAQRWEGDNPTPVGVILVEELGNIDAISDAEKKEIASSNASCFTRQEVSPPSTKVWGLLVQGRGVSWPTCYILKTCRVQCCFGFSTHFCLAKVDCFGQSIDFHLNKFWLQK